MPFYQSQKTISSDLDTLCWSYIFSSISAIKDYINPRAAGKRRARRGSARDGEAYNSGGAMGWGHFRHLITRLPKERPGAMCTDKQKLISIYSFHCLTEPKVTTVPQTVVTVGKVDPKWHGATMVPLCSTGISSSLRQK